MNQTAKSAAGVVPWKAGGLMVVVAALGMAVPTASGQISTLDDRAFMEALQRRGMLDVMNRFMATTKTSDPLLSLQFKIAAAKAKATQQVNRRNKKAVEGRKAAALEVIALYEELFKKAPADHWEQPIWKTDYCDWVLGTVLPDRYVYAHLFVQFGRPISREPESGTDLDNQRAAYDALVAKAIKHMNEAASEWRELEVTAPRQPDFTRKFVNTGRWRKLKGLYGDILLPFHRSWAIYHGHFMTKPAGDLKEAAGLIKNVAGLPFMKGKVPNKAVADFRQQVYSRSGRIFAAQKNYRQAISYLNAAINNRAPAAVTLPAAIARQNGSGGGSSAGIWDVPLPETAMTNDRKFSLKVAKKQRSILATKSDAKPSQQPGPTFKIELTSPLEKIVALRLDLIPHAKLGGGSGTGRNGNFMLSEIKVTATPLKAGAGKKVDVKFTKAHATFSQVRPRDQGVDQAIDGKEDRENGWAVSPDAKKFNAALFVADKPFGFKGGTKLTVQLVSVNKYGAVGHFRFAVSGSPAVKSGGPDFLGPINISNLPSPKERAEAQKKAEAERKKAEAERQKAEAARKKAEADSNKSTGEPDSMIIFETKLAKAYAYAGAGRVGNGLELLESMSHQKPANVSPLLLVLLADAKYRIDGKNEKHYKTLLDSPEASGWKAYIEEFLVKRDGAETPDIDDENVNRFFASVKLILNKANGARDKAKDDPKAKEEAKRHYTDADGYLERFLKKRGDNLAPDEVGRAYQMRARAQYNLGLYDAKHMGTAALFFVASAQAYKGQKEGEESCKYGLILSQKIYDLMRSEGRPVAKAAPRLAKAFEVLFTVYDKSGLAKDPWYEDQKFFYGEFLTLQKQWGNAFEALGQVKPTSQYNVRALYLRSRCAHALWIEAAEKKKEEWAQTVRDVGTNALRALPLAIRKASNDPQKKKTLRKAEAITKLNLAEIKYESLNDPRGAAVYLENFDQLYNDFPELLVDKQRINIGITIQTGKMETALDDINKFVKADPKQARLLLRNLLPALNRRIKTLRVTGKEAEAQKVADFALMLAKEIMFPLAKQSGDKTLILNYSLIVANQEMVAGKTDEALASYQTILDANPNNLNANKGLFDALIAVGKETEARELGREMDLKLEKQAREGELGDDEMRAYWEVVRDLAKLWDNEFVRRCKAARTDVEKRKADEYGAKIWKYLLHKRQLHKSLGPLAIQGDLVRLINRHDPEKRKALRDKGKTDC